MCADARGAGCIYEYCDAVAEPRGGGEIARMHSPNSLKKNFFTVKPYTVYVI